MRGAWWLAALLLAGCLGSTADGTVERDPAAESALEALDFEGVFDVFPTAMEPEDQRGSIVVAWQDGLFAVDNEKEFDLAQHTVVDGATAYTSRTGAKWTAWPLDDAVAQGRLSNRLVLWDVPRLLRDPGTTLAAAQEDGRTVLRGDVALGLGLEAQVEVVVEGGRPAAMRIEADEGREAPFTIAPGRSPLRFAVQVPATVLAAQQVEAGDAQAKAGHDQVAALVLAYCRTRAGVLPDSVDPETLRVELLASGQEWPRSPYDDAALRHGGGSGHFEWDRASPTEGTYTGLGWDGGVVLHFFGPVQCAP